MTNDKISYVYVALSVILWGTTAAVAKLMLKNLDNLQVLFIGSIIAAISLLVIVIVQNKIKIIKKYSLNDYWNFAYMGFIGIFLYFVFLYGALMFAPAQEAFIVNYTWPIWVIIFSTLILKEKINIKKIIAILLSFLGVYFVVTKGDLFALSISNFKGNILALAGAVCYGLFSVLGKKHDYERFTSMLFYFTFTSIYVFIAMLIFSNIPSITTTEFIGLTWLGIFTSALPHVFWFLALKHGDTAKMSNIIFLTPFVSLIFIFFLIGEKILFSSIIGLILIVAGIIIQSYKKRP